jgi:hypothetical protein
MKLALAFTLAIQYGTLLPLTVFHQLFKERNGVQHNVRVAVFKRFNKRRSGTPQRLTNLGFMGTLAMPIRCMDATYSVPAALQAGNQRQMGCLSSYIRPA